MCTFILKKGKEINTRRCYGFRFRYQPKPIQGVQKLNTNQSNKALVFIFYLQ